MKKDKPIVIQQDPGKKARRAARAVVGAVKPSTPIPPRTQRKPKHKRPPDADIE